MKTKIKKPTICSIKPQPKQFTLHKMSSAIEVMQAFLNAAKEGALCTHSSKLFQRTEPITEKVCDVSVAKQAALRKGTRRRRLSEGSGVTCAEDKHNIFNHFSATWTAWSSLYCLQQVMHKKEFSSPYFAEDKGSSELFTWASHSWIRSPSMKWELRLNFISLWDNECYLAALYFAKMNSCHMSV